MDALKWIEDHDGLAGWLQAIGATIAIALTYFLASDGARRAREDAERQHILRKRAVLRSAMVNFANLTNVAERYENRVRTLVGAALIEHATEAYREFARIDQQMGTLPLHDLDGDEAFQALYLARLHTASAMETYSHLMSPSLRETPIGASELNALAAYKTRFEEAFVAFEAEERRMPKT